MQYLQSRRTAALAGRNGLPAVLSVIDMGHAELGVGGPHEDGDAGGQSGGKCQPFTRSGYPRMIKPCTPGGVQVRVESRIFLRRH